MNDTPDDNDGVHTKHFLLRLIRSMGYPSAEDFCYYISDIAYEDLKPLLKGSRGQTIAVDHSETYVALAQLVDRRIGELLSVREELQRKLNNDRRARQARRQAIGER